MPRMTVLKEVIIVAVVACRVTYAQALTTISASGAVTATSGLFNDSGWTIAYQEDFDTDFVAQDGQTFGADGWLVFQLINDGEITVENGYAQLDAPDFWNAALIRSTHILPEVYKIRTKIGYINYDLTNYEQADYDDPDFDDHEGYYENGMYFLTLTDDTCIGYECAEMWWHYHRKMVIDVDNHVDYEGPGEVFHPVYMVYMAPETNSGGNLLRTWDGTAWDDSPWNWNVAYTYEYNTWYYAELEKTEDHLILRLYDENHNIIEETTPVSLDLVNAIDDPIEYFYVGEPHTDDYEGDVRIDEITLLYPDNSVDVADNEPSTDVPEQFAIFNNYPNPFNPSTTIEYSLPKRTEVTITVHNIRGQKVQTLVEDVKSVGYHKVVWNGTDSQGEKVASGVYFYRIEAGDFAKSRKMLLLK